MQITLLQIKIILICRIFTFAKLRYSENLQLARFTKRGVLFAVVSYFNILVALYEILSCKKQNKRKKVTQAVWTLKNVVF